MRTSYGILSSIVGICCNILLFTAKLLIGAGMNSLAIMADAFNNLSDAASSVISFVGVKMANKPADKEHPFGHGRIEYIAALIVSFLVIEVGLRFLKSSLEKNPQSGRDHISDGSVFDSGALGWCKAVDGAFQPKTGKPHSVEGDAGNVGGFHGRRDHDERNDRFYIDLPFPFG